MLSVSVSALMITTGLLLSCTNSAHPTTGAIDGGDGVKLIVRTGEGAPGGGALQIVDPRSFSALYSMNYQAMVVSLGAAGAIPAQPTYRIRYHSDLPSSLTYLRGAYYTEYDNYDVPYTVERIVQVPHEYCRKVVADNELKLDYVTMLAPVYPRYLDGNGQPVTPRPISSNDTPYVQRRPEQTLIPGERIVLFSSCPRTSFCTEVGKCPNRIAWKFPVSAEGTVDFSHVGGRSAVPVGEVSAYLQAVIEGREPPPVDGGAGGGADGGTDGGP